MKIILPFFLLFSLSIFGQSEIEKAEKLYHQKKYNEAKELFNDYLKSNTENTKVIEYLGNIAGFQKKWKESIKLFEKLKIIVPNSANYWYKYGCALSMEAKISNKIKAVTMIDEIENAFLTAAKLDSKHIDTRWALVMLYIELPGIVGGSEKKAQKYADELMSLSKVDGYLSKGYIDEYFERYDKAESDYIKAHEIGNSKTTFQKLYNLYSNKIKDKTKAQKLKEQYKEKITNSKFQITK